MSVRARAWARAARHRRPEPDHERGAGSVLAVAIVGAIAAIAIAVVPILGLHVGRQRAMNAADAAALAAADAVSGAVAGTPCVLAAEIASRNGATLTACEIEGPEASVSVVVELPLARLGAEARAGPPG